jgi:hypothetical protein
MFSENQRGVTCAAHPTDNLRKVTCGAHRTGTFSNRCARRPARAPDGKRAAVPFRNLDAGKKCDRSFFRRVTTGDAHATGRRRARGPCPPFRPRPKFNRPFIG